MASHAREDVTVGLIVSRTVETVQANARAGMIFIAALSAIGILGDYLSVGGLSEEAVALGGVVRLLSAIATIVGSYLLMEAILDRAGLLSYRGSKRYFAFLGQSIVLAIGVMVGLVLLVVPGMILAVRWSLAQALLIGRGAKVFESMGESWRKTAGYGWRIFFAVLLVGVAFIVLLGVIFVFLGESSLAGIALSQIVGNAFTVVLSALGVSLLGLIDPAGDSLSEVFE